MSLAGAFPAIRPFPPLLSVQGKAGRLGKGGSLSGLLVTESASIMR